MNTTAEQGDPSLRPRDVTTGESLQPTRSPGYYPGFSTLSQSPFWDEATRLTIERRVESLSQMKFFTAEEWKFWTIVFAHLIPQTDRTADRQISIVGPLDRRLHLNQTVG